MPFFEKNIYNTILQNAIYSFSGHSVHSFILQPYHIIQHKVWISNSIQSKIFKIIENRNNAGSGF